MRALIAVALLLQASVACADETVEIGGLSLRLGMLEQTVMEKLGPYFRINCPAEKFKSCMLMNKDGPPYSPVANLVFENGKLAQARKYWSIGYEGTDPSKLVETLYSALVNVSGAAPATVRLELVERRDPGSVAKAIYISQGRKTVSVTVTEGLKSQGTTIPTFVNVDEFID